MSQSIPPRQSPPNDPPEPPEDGPTPEQKEQYSLNEMLRALRDQERQKEEKGEIVTRSDGSIARKVKRRRRRSDQPETDKAAPEKVKKRIVVKILIAAAICLFALLGFLALILSFNTKAYSEKAEVRAGEWTGAEVELNGLKLMPTSVKMSEASFTWPQTSYFRSLNLKRLDGHAGLLSFFGATMGGLEVGGTVGELMIAMPSAVGAVGTHYEDEKFPFNFGRYFCDTLDVGFGESNVLALKGASVSLRHLGDKGWRASIDQGILSLKGWEDFPIANGMVHFRDGEVELASLTLERPSRDASAVSGSLKLSGIIPLTEGKSTTLPIEASGFPAEKLFGKQMGRLFDGLIRNSTGEITYTMGNESFDEIELHYVADYLEMVNFPFLLDLRELFPGEGYDTIQFESDVEGTLRVRPEGVAIEKIKMSHKKTFRLNGNLIVSPAGELAGNLTLWINHGLIVAEPRLKSYPGLNKVEKAFSRVDFEVGGTMDAPTDTFRTAAGLRVALPGVREPTAAPPGEDLWDRFTKPDSAMEEEE